MFAVILEIFPVENVQVTNRMTGQPENLSKMGFRLMTPDGEIYAESFGNVVSQIMAQPLQVGDLVYALVIFSVRKYNRNDGRQGVSNEVKLMNIYRVK